MPVLSPHRSSSTFRTSYSSALDRPYYSSNYTPRISSYSERFTSRSFTDSDGRRLFSRSSSITEDGVTTRYREDSRDTGALNKRESVSRDSGISSIRENSILDYPRTRDSSLSRESSRLSSVNVVDSLADMRNKYSPHNYVPAVHRKNDNITRSKSINDIGLPPIEKIKKKDIPSSRSAVSPPSTSIPSSVATSATLNSNSLPRRSTDRGRSYVTNDDDDDDEPSSHSNSYYDRYRRVSTSPTKSQGLNGLKNIGNTCFMNSVVQCLSNTRLLSEYLRKDHYAREVNSTASNMKGALIKAFAELIKELWSEDSNDRVVNTVSFKSQIQRFAPRFMGYSQQDAQEFLRYLLEGLHEDVNKVTDKPKPIHTEIDDNLSDSEKSAEAWRRYLRMDNSCILDIFVGQLKSTLRCTHCGHCSVTFDPFWDLSLPIPQRTSQLRLSQCLEYFTREETLDGDEKPTCAKCKERRKCTKSFTIQKFPKILVIHLKRFSPTERYRGKLSVTVDFPLEGLDMSPYASNESASCRYSLYAVSNHSGTPYSGHYTAYCKHPYTKLWHEYNDSRVSPVNPRSVVSGEAYVLFYEQEGQKSRL